MNDQHGSSPFLPNAGERNPKPPVTTSQPWRLALASANRQLLAQSKIFKNDRSMTTEEQEQQAKTAQNRAGHSSLSVPLSA